MKIKTTKPVKVPAGTCVLFSEAQALARQHRARKDEEHWVLLEDQTFKAGETLNIQGVVRIPRNAFTVLSEEGIVPSVPEFEPEADAGASQSKRGDPLDDLDIGEGPAKPTITKPKWGRPKRESK